MTKRKTYHVTTTDGGWKGKIAGNELSSVVRPTKAEAVAATVAMAKRAGKTSVIIHKMNGQFQEERTYPKKSDPFPPRG